MEKEAGEQGTHSQRVKLSLGEVSWGGKQGHMGLRRLRQVTQAAK